MKRSEEAELLRHGKPIFPGRNAGASLKQHVLFRYHDHCRIFPGRNAGASLKREIQNGRASHHCLSSPAEMPGPH